MRFSFADSTYWYTDLSFMVLVEPGAKPLFTRSTVTDGWLNTSGIKPSPTGPRPAAVRSEPVVNSVWCVVLSRSAYVTARKLSGASEAKVTSNRWSSGTRSEFTTATSTDPVPVPATWDDVVTVAAAYPGTRGSGRTATALIGRINPPRGVRETGIEFSDG